MPLTSPEEQVSWNLDLALPPPVLRNKGLAYMPGPWPPLGQPQLTETGGLHTLLWRQRQETPRYRGTERWVALTTFGEERSLSDRRAVAPPRTTFAKVKVWTAPTLASNELRLRLGGMLDVALLQAIRGRSWAEGATAVFQGILQSSGRGGTAAFGWRGSRRTCSCLGLARRVYRDLCAPRAATVPKETP